MWNPDIDREDYEKAYKYSVTHFGVASLVNIMMRAYDEMQMRNKKKIDTDCLDAAYSWIRGLKQCYLDKGNIKDQSRRASIAVARIRKVVLRNPRLLIVSGSSSIMKRAREFAASVSLKS